jgi:HEAT repeat protein
VVSLFVPGISYGDDFKAKADDAFAKLAAYDFGKDPSATAAIASMVAQTYGKPAERKELAARLAAVLSSGAPRGAKDFACRQLSIIGTGAEVPALAEFLADEKLSHMARYALERIPDPVACEAIRQALGKVQGKLRVGMINSLGNRRSQAAVADLAGLLGDSDPAVAQAAAVALGKIGPAGAAELAKALDGAAPKVRPAVAQAMLLCAEGFLAQGKRDDAAAIYDRLRKANVKAVKVAAARGIVLARQAAGIPVLVEQLKGTDPDLFGAGLVLVRELPGAEATKAVVAELANLPAEKQILLLEALADRGDRAATPAALSLAQQGAGKVRVTAIHALARLGDASAVPGLVALAISGEGDVAPAAVNSLASLPGKDVDAAVQAVLDGGDAKARRVAIDVLGQRRVASAAPSLVKAAADADESIRLAAVKALGETVALGDLSALVDLGVKAKQGKELAAVEAAIASACARMPDREACAEILASSLPKAEAAARSALLRSLGRVAGAKALEAVRAAVKESAADVRETALRVMADWPDAAAAADLLALAKSSESKTHKILALRGYIRLIGLSSQPADQKLAMCKEALGLAERDEERKLVLGALGGVPAAEALAIVVPFFDNPAAKDEAAAAAVAIGEKIAGSHAPQTADAMKKALKVTANADLQKRAREVLQRAGGK